MIRKLIVSVFVCLSFFCYGSDRYRIAVTGFEDIRKNDDTLWIGRAISETVVSDLTRLRDIVVIDRSEIDRAIEEMKLGLSGMIDENEALEVGKFLQANTIISGSYTVLGDQMRITANLTDLETLKIIGSSKVTGDMVDLFALMDTVVLDIIGGVKDLAASLNDEVIREIKIIKTENLKALQFFILGADANYRGHYETAEQQLDNALQLDPFYIDPLIEKARLKKTLGYYAEARELLEKAKNLAENSGDNYLLGWIYSETGNMFINEGDNAEGMRYLNRAMEIYKEYDVKGKEVAETLNHIGWVKLLEGAYQEALENFQRAREIYEEFGLSPAKAYNLIGSCYFFSGDFEKALENYNTTLDYYLLDGTGGNEYASVLNNMANIYYQMEQFSRAIELYEEAVAQLEKDGNISLSAGTAYENIAFCYYCLGKEEQTREYWMKAKEIYLNFKREDLADKIDEYSDRFLGDK